MAAIYSQVWTPVDRVAKPAYLRVCGAARKNLELVFAPFSYPYPLGTNASQCIAIYTIPISTNWTIRYPFTQPTNSFVALVRYVIAGVTYRYKLWSGVGEIMPYNNYIGETLPAGTVIEIWSAINNPAVLASQWVLRLGLLELQDNPCDQDGTEIGPSVCIPFDYTRLTDIQTLLASCAL